MSTPEPRTTTNDRALVLAGAGAAGNAWELGLVAGLAAAGVDLTDADLVVGTSAGSTAAAQITSGARPADLYAAVVAEAPPAGPGPARPARATSQSFMDWSDTIIASSADPSDMRRRMGAAALAKDTADDESTRRWRETVAARLPRRDWPARLVRIAVVDARTGEPVVLDRDSGIDLVDAVAASTSNGFAGTYGVGERRFINGGYRRNENADLAAGYGRVLVLSPFGGRTRHPLAWRTDLAAQVAELRAGGSSVEVVVPDASAGDVFDARAMDPSTRPQAARGGYEQGRALAGRLATFWV
ncbi:patatin-like phospholipase family protein [Cellulomonas sp. PhB150]|uniref:patatin-like phospholipase family protein n=1 Tax=Cellulomonas sp. PhB150 TaxID=2485188 RepID=UPI000F460557|nr:patatin-like phospholipase family protein [Cellulomonas sp. PhB150]ROS27889.1 NTE family protein [Cellulomonas sp. PhB150]